MPTVEPGAYVALTAGMSPTSTGKCLVRQNTMYCWPRWISVLGRQEQRSPETHSTEYWRSCENGSSDRRSGQTPRHRAQTTDAPRHVGGLVVQNWRSWDQRTAHSITMRLCCDRMPNQVTGPNAGGLRQFPIRTPLAARVGHFCRSPGTMVRARW